MQILKSIENYDASIADTKLASAEILEKRKSLICSLQSHESTSKAHALREVLQSANSHSKKDAAQQAGESGELHGKNEPRLHVSSARRRRAILPDAIMIEPDAGAIPINHISTGIDLHLSYFYDSKSGSICVTSGAGNPLLCKSRNGTNTS